MLPSKVEGAHGIRDKYARIVTCGALGPDFMEN
jgi:hypothetical protein